MRTMTQWQNALRNRTLTLYLIHRSLRAVGMARYSSRAEYLVWRKMYHYAMRKGA